MCNTRRWDHKNGISAPRGKT